MGFHVGTLYRKFVGATPLVTNRNGDDNCLASGAEIAGLKSDLELRSGETLWVTPHTQMSTAPSRAETEVKRFT